MPKLSGQDARTVEAAAEESEKRFQPIPQGVYVLQLVDVDVSDAPGDSGFHYWIWKFRVLDEAYRGKELQLITSLSPQAAFAIGLAFAAFGVPADTHTDELLGQRCMGYVIQRPDRKDPSRIFNSISNVTPYDAEQDETPLNAGVGVSAEQDF